MSEFDKLVSELAAEARALDVARAPALAPRPASPSGSEQWGQRTSIAFKSIGAQLDEVVQDGAHMRLRGFAPGLGARIPGDPTPLRVYEIDPAYGRVRTGGAHSAASRNRGGRARRRQRGGHPHAPGASGASPLTCKLKA